MSRMAATTEITLDPPEFDEYTIGVDGEITFCLKELRVSYIMASRIMKDILLLGYSQLHRFNSSTVNHQF